MANILIVGSGGRECSLAWGFAVHGHKVFVAPGNGGTERYGENVPVARNQFEADWLYFEALEAFARKRRVDLIIAGSENFLAAGMGNYFRRVGRPFFGPNDGAARIESSKAFAKQAMKAEGIPTAPFRIFDSHAEAYNYIAQCGMPVVVKADGLAAGKGAQVCKTFPVADRVLGDFMLSRIHGDAGSTVVIESFLPGVERSAHVFCDGKHHYMVPFLFADYKLSHDDGKGDNTGSMGTVAPVPGIVRQMIKRIESQAVAPILEFLERQETSFMGCLYPGLMIAPDGTPNVLEYNGRLGDSECQVLMMMLKSDPNQIFGSCTNQTLDQVQVEWHRSAVACITVTSGGYPRSYKTGYEVAGIEEAERVSGVTVFHAGTRRQDGKILTDGGRVLNIMARADDLESALALANEAADRIQFEGMHRRRKIGTDLLHL